MENSWVQGTGVIKGAGGTEDWGCMCMMKELKILSETGSSHNG